MSRKKLKCLSLLSPVTNHVVPEVAEDDVENEVIIASEKNRFTCQHCRQNFDNLQDMVSRNILLFSLRFAFSHV